MDPAQVNTAEAGSGEAAIDPAQAVHNSDIPVNSPITPKQEDCLHACSIKPDHDEDSKTAAGHAEDRDRTANDTVKNETEDNDCKMNDALTNELDDGSKRAASNLGLTPNENAGASGNIQAPRGEGEMFANVEQVLSCAPDTIAKGVKVGLETLECLRKLFNVEGTAGREASRWLAKIDTSKQKLKETRTVVGIVGNTGAGKSSLINALLDEEDIIHTSSMDACTAVPTEISYNHDEGTECTYRAEVEFITEEDWERDITILLAELVDPSNSKKLSPDHLQSDTGAGIAYEKIKAVYPHLSTDRLAKTDVQDLMDDAAVKDVLGTVMSLKKTSASDLNSALGIYVKSPTDESTGAQGDKAMAYWPLVKVVRIYLKSKVLSTGTVLVDLPGVQDSNAARSAVADRFRAECSSLWIVSPIPRAKADKPAKDLLGTSFKLQLAMDGSYANVTFICSKTDDLNERELAREVDTDGAIRAIWAREEECSREVSELQREKRVLTGQRDEIADVRDELEARRSRKRKLAVDASDEDGAAADADLEEEMATARQKSVSIRKQLNEVKARIGALEEEGDKLGIEARGRCIEARNNYTTKAIRSDFADSVREMREDAEAQGTGIDLPPAEPDYAQIAMSLPVFCVSSRGYQSLTGRFKDRGIQGFRTLADTQIPQLQEHAMKLSHLEIGAARKGFLARLGRLFRALVLWSSVGHMAGQSATKAPSSSEDHESKISRLDQLLATLQLDLDNELKSAISMIKTKLEHDLLEPMSSICAHASLALPAIASGWPQKELSPGKRMRFCTYRSICVNEGKGTTRISRALNFNEELFVPLKRRMAAHWASTFGNTFNPGVARYAAGTIEVLKDFHKSATDLAEMESAKLRTLGVLEDQLAARIQSIREAEAKYKKGARVNQRLASRWFVEHIAAYMKAAYEKCAKERGAGSYIRMKETMDEFVSQHCQKLLRKALEEVSDQLANECSLLEQQIKQRNDKLVAGIMENYQTAILGWETVPAGSGSSPVLLEAQARVKQELLKVDSRFAALVRGDGAKEHNGSA